MSFMGKKRPLSTDAKIALLSLVFGAGISGILQLITEPDNLALAIAVIGILAVGGYFLLTRT